MSAAPNRGSGCSTRPAPTRSRSSTRAASASGSRAVTPSTTAISSSAPKVKRRRGLRANGWPITPGKSTICARRSTGPFRQAAMRSIGVALTAAAVPLWMRLSLLEECRSRAKQALGALGTGGTRDPREEMRLHAALGASTAEAPEMGAAFTKALEIAESLGDSEYQLRALGACISFTPGAVDTVLRCHLRKGSMIWQRAGSDLSDRLFGERMMGAGQTFSWRPDQRTAPSGASADSLCRHRSWTGCHSLPGYHSLRDDGKYRRACSLRGCCGCRGFRIRRCALPE